MLTEQDMALLAALASKLTVEGYDVSALRAIMLEERKSINKAEAADLTAYFPVKDTIQLKLGNIKYGLQPLTINLQLIVERLSGVFDQNSKPDRFEGILKNAIYNCLKGVKEQYFKEVDALINKPSTTIKKGTSANPLSFTFGQNNILYADSGDIDTAVAWTVQSITDSSSNSLSGGGVSTTATASAPILLALSDGNGNVKNMSCTSGTFAGDDVTTTATAVAIGGGE